MIVVLEVGEEEVFKVLEELERLFFPHQISRIVKDGKYTITISTSLTPYELFSKLREHGLLEYFVLMERKGEFR